MNRLRRALPFALWLLAGLLASAGSVACGEPAPSTDRGVTDEARGLAPPLAESESDVSVALAKDEHVEAPVDISVDFPVDVIVTNGASAIDVEVLLSMVSSDPCEADWLPEADDTVLAPIDVGPLHISRLRFLMSDQPPEGLLEPDATRSAARTDRAVCTAP
ncbi:MAG: hypothetical protein E3J64_04130, partial [Anaerolineales bacterium]